jgi:hypothetical protein
MAAGLAPGDGAHAQACREQSITGSLRGPKAAKANRNLFAAAGARNKATVAQVRARINGMMQSRIERYASLVAR